jgi:DNA-binding transcriptional MerR regulator
MADSFDQTTGSLARLAGKSPQTIRLYVKLGLIECIRSADGRRLFPASAADRVREIYTRRLARKVPGRS